MWGQLVMDTIVAPRAAAQRVLAMPVPVAALVEAAVAIACVGLVFGYVASALSGGPVDPVSTAVLGVPLVGALVQLAVMAVVTGLTWRVGGLFGGRGSLIGAAQAVIWLNAVTLVLQLAQIAALAVVPPLATLVALGALFWLLWAYANFVTELHGFETPVVVLGVVILTVIALALGLSILARLLGLAPQG